MTEPATETPSTVEPATETPSTAEQVDATPSTAEPATETPVTPEVPRLNVLADLFTKTYASTRSCFVLGATGETGRRIASTLIESGAFALVRLLVRRQVPEDFLPEPAAGVKIEQIVVPDFNTIAEDSTVLNGCEFGFCALGTTKKKAGGEEQFYQIDHDLTLKLLRLAKSSGCKYLALVSAAGSAASSIFLYSKTKGQLENDAIALQFDALRIYRPALIQVKRKDKRLLEDMASALAPILDFCSLGRAAVKVDVLADSIVKDALIYGSETGDFDEKKKKLVFYDNKSIKQDR